MNFQFVYFLFIMQTLVLAIGICYNSLQLRKILYPSGTQRRTPQQFQVLGRSSLFIRLSIRLGQSSLSLLSNHLQMQQLATSAITVTKKDIINSKQHTPSLLPDWVRQLSYYSIIQILSKEKSSRMWIFWSFSTLSINL